MTAAMRSCLLLGCFWATNRRYSLDDKFSIGFKSGLFSGHCSSFTPCDWNHIKHFPAVWQGAPSCWKMYDPLSPNRSRANGSNLASSTFWMYLSAFTLLSRTCRRPTLVLDTRPHTMMLTGCFIVGTVHSGSKSSSPALRGTYLIPSLPNIEMRVSSLQMTLAQSSFLQFKCSLAHCSLFCLCLAFGYGFFCCFDWAMRWHILLMTRVSLCV